MRIDAKEDYATLQQNAQNFVAESRYGEALVEFSKILESDAENQLKAQAASEAAEVLTLLGQFDEAIVHFETANKLLKESDIPKAFRREMEIVYEYHLANCYALAGEWREAKIAFERFIERESEGKDASLLSAAQRKLEWIQQRVFAKSKPTLRFAASLLAFLLTISLCLYIFAKDPLSYLNLSLSFLALQS